MTKEETLELLDNLLKKWNLKNLKNSLSTYMKILSPLENQWQKNMAIQ